MFLEWQSIRRFRSDRPRAPRATVAAGSPDTVDADGEIVAGPTVSDDDAVYGYVGAAVAGVLCNGVTASVALDKSQSDSDPGSSGSRVVVAWVTPPPPTGGSIAPFLMVGIGALLVGMFLVVADRRTDAMPAEIPGSTAEAGS